MAPLSPCIASSPSVSTSLQSPLHRAGPCGVRGVEPGAALRAMQSHAQPADDAARMRFWATARSAPPAVGAIGVSRWQDPSGVGRAGHGHPGVLGGLPAQLPLWYSWFSPSLSPWVSFKFLHPGPAAQFWLRREAWCRLREKLLA